MTTVEPQASHVVSVHDAFVRVQLRGELDLAVAADVSHWLDEAMEAHPDKGLEIDLHALEFLDSSGIRALLNAYTAVTANGRAFRVVGATGGVREVLEIVDVLDLLTGDGNL